MSPSHSSGGLFSCASDAAGLGLGREGSVVRASVLSYSLGFDFAGIGRHRNSSGQELGEEIPALGLGRELSAGTSGCRGSAGVWEV